MPAFFAKDLIEEIAHIQGGRDITRGYVGNIWKWLATQDKLLNSRGGGSLELYEETAQEPQIKSCLQQRFRALIAYDWRVLPGGEKDIDKEAASDLERHLKAFSFDDRTEKMLWGLYYGFSAGEAIYERQKGKVVLKDILVRNRRRFAFDANKKLLLKTFDAPQGLSVPDRKFWTFSCGADNDDEPYGRGLAYWLYWPAYFKRNGWRWWLRYLELFATPARVGKYPAGATAEEKNILWDMLSHFGQDDRLMFPEGLDVSLIESSRSGTSDYSTLKQELDGEIAKIILSQTMTTDDGASLSQAQVHAGVAADIVRADVDLICDSFNAQVGRWLTEWNYPGAAIPRLVRTPRKDPDLNSLVNRDRTLAEMGFPPTADYVVATYGEGFRPADPDNPQLGSAQVSTLLQAMSSANQQSWSSEVLAAVLGLAVPSAPPERIEALVSAYKKAADAAAAPPLTEVDPEASLEEAFGQ